MNRAKGVLQQAGGFEHADSIRREAPGATWRALLAILALLGGAVLGAQTGCQGSTEPGAPTAMRLLFSTASANVWAGAPISPPVIVVVEDAYHNAVTTPITSVTLAIGTNPGGGTLSGTTTVATVNGLATFSNLSIDKAGAGYTLTATALGLPSGSSTAFRVVPSFVSLSAGGGSYAPMSGSGVYTCGVNTRGVTYCWGANTYGQLGVGTTNTFGPVAGGVTFATVSTGTYTTCGLTVGGAAYCWGANFYGALGNGTTTASTTPVAVLGGLTFAKISVGFARTCGVTRSGAAYCWGTNGYAGTLSNSATPVAVSGGLTFATVSTGDSFNCGVTTGGAAYCWGNNYSGELGNGTTNASETPVAVLGGLTFATVSAGGSHACGVTTLGAAYCWGYNGYGQLGNGTRSDDALPVAVSAGLTFATISTVDSYTCGVTTLGAAYCWGANDHGQLGNGTGGLGGDFNASPVAVSGGLTFATVSAGNYSACGVTTLGAAYCWGYNSRTPVLIAPFDWIDL